jgi:hypothetical protein
MTILIDSLAANLDFFFGVGKMLTIMVLGGGWTLLIGPLGCGNQKWRIERGHLVTGCDSGSFLRDFTGHEFLIDGMSIIRLVLIFSSITKLYTQPKGISL